MANKLHHIILRRRRRRRRRVFQAELKNWRMLFLKCRR